MVSLIPFLTSPKITLLYLNDLKRSRKLKPEIKTLLSYYYDFHWGKKRELKWYLWEYYPHEVFTYISTTIENWSLDTYHL